MTTWTEREEPTTNRTPRQKPSIFIAPLEGVNDVIVHDEDDEIVFIISNEGKLVVLTNRTPRPVLND